MTPAWPVLALAAVCGLALGSYAVTAGLRISRSEGSARGRSRCDACGGALGFAHTIPLASYVHLRGACGHCGARIDPVHLAGELAGLAVLVCAAATGDPLRAAPLAVLGLALVATATVDAKVQRLPDAFAAVVAIAGLALSLLSGGSALRDGLLAAAVAVVVLSLIREAARRTRGDPGLGLGDVKLIAGLALWLGLATPVMVAVAAIVGLAVAPFARGADGRLAFGPSIALAGWLVGMASEVGWTPWAL